MNYSTRADDTSYMFGSSPGIITIWDGGGEDWINVGGLMENFEIDLQPGHFSSIFGDKNVAMALVDHLPDKSRPLIENIFSGDGDDNLTGNKANNTILSGQGKNYLNGMDGDDILFASGKNDTLEGGRGNDALVNNLSDGDTQYVFSRGDGHDGIIDMHSVESSNIDIILKGLVPSDIVLKVNYHPDIGYGRVYLEASDTGDTLILPWPYFELRDSYFIKYLGHDYSDDTISFSDGTIWTVNHYESHIQVNNVASPAALNDTDSIIFDWYREGVPGIFGPY